MEPEVHIIERYFQEKEHCLTMSNIKCGRKEIDLLAINPRKNKKYHVEASVHTTQGFALKNIDSLRKEKFEVPIIKEKIHEIFGEGEYIRMLVVWYANKNIREASKRKYDIEILPMKTILTSLILRLMSRGHPKGSRDDVLRTVELLNLGFKFVYRKRNNRRPLN
jgi:hypothetical protein